MLTAEMELHIDAMIRTLEMLKKKHVEAFNHPGVFSIQANMVAYQRIARKQCQEFLDLTEPTKGQRNV